ncbi:A/G-specific adenine glycosylase [Asticcacaulis sp. ZE23SCel15]|uniref:A/G-specific adenine glycosylase n=1 Tax=Asticcacaulis sp. ZE23SCel15 TaxID=3059027 RepID=UPI00265E44EC|nr:A/G-specific adenine glycosylase [Asticcacaulis sp. ZE23SCel15]WKL56808.1 A/G-specific adenine glycosylase [Asticcacaulis sp. ZE23SCel15]
MATASSRDGKVRFMTTVINLSADDVSRLRLKLLNWYDDYARPLPWRRLPGDELIVDPYRIWLSEVMLQQTTVPHAAPYYEAFLKRWPTVHDLASAEDGEVMAAWAGLGYYSRARNLLKGARVIVDQYAGAFPDDETRLLKIPSFGPYTAAAVAAFAFDKPANVVDGNIERIMSRLYAVDEPMPAAKPALKALAAQWVRSDRASDWPQALMDLASSVCRPKSPKCTECPLSEGCLAHHLNRPENYPVRLSKTPKPHRYGVVFLIVSDEGFIVERRPDKGLLGGMLGLPHLDWRDKVWTDVESKNQLLISGGVKLIGRYDHVFTHFRLTQDVWFQRITAPQLTDFLRRHNQYQYLSFDDKKALPTVFGKALKFIPSLV